MKLKLYILFLLSFVTIYAMADGVTLTASAPSTVDAGGKFRVQFTVNTQNVSNFNYPDFNGFEVIYGPATSSQSSFQMINGRTSQSSSIIYTFVLVAEKPGTYTIGSASVVSDGNTIKSNPVKIKVLPAGTSSNAGAHGGNPYAGSSNQGAAATQPSRPSSSTGVASKDLFMTANASKTSVNEQEAILLTYKLYTLLDVTQLDGKLPTLDGFQIQEIPLPRTKEFTFEQYNGRTYKSVVWSQYLLFPQKSGTLTIPSINYESTIITRNQTMDPFEAFFNGQSGYQEIKKTISTPTVNIKVSPLPAKPENYSGGVGTFTVSSSINATEIDANEALTIKVNVSGTGNMKLISAPVINFPRDFESYDPKVTDNFDITSSGLKGNKEFEYVVVPRHAGKYTIPAAQFVYFDTSSRTYKTLTTQSYEINVNKGKGGASTVADYSGNKQEVKDINTDIRFIKKGDVDYQEHGYSFFGTLSYILCYLIPLLVFVVLMMLYRKQMKSRLNVAATKGKKANKVALRRMKTAKKLLDNHDQANFYDEVLRALWGYVGDKFTISQENLSKENITDALNSRNVSEPIIEQLLATLNDCEFARYAPGDADQNMNNVYESAIEAITKMEK